MYLALTALGVFVSALLIEWCDTLNTLAVTRGRPLAAAAASIAMYALGLVGFYAFFEVAWWMLVPEAAGLALGAYVSVRRAAGRDGVARERHKVQPR